MTGRDPLPRHTTPTWEMELLISGATVFALLQLPGVLDEMFYAYFPRFERPYAEMVMLPYLYVKTAVYALILTFVLHLAMRGYWVALVGLRSVYGDGVRWDKLRWGPGYLRVLRERTPPVDELVERADNRASLVFSYGIALALVTLAPLLMVGLVAIATWGVHLLLGGRVPWQSVWTVLLVAMMVPLFASIFFDRWFGRRLPEDGRIARTLRGVFRGYLRIGMASASTYPLLVFASRAGQKRAGAMMFVAVSLMFGLTFVQLMAREGDLDVGSYGDLALGNAGAARALRNEHYADRRPADLSATAPFIPSEVVRGDWLRLFVPFRPGRDSRALDAACGQAPVPQDAMQSAGARGRHASDAAPPEEAREAQADGSQDGGGGDAAPTDEERDRIASDAARARVLDCLAQAYAPALDGTPLAGVRFDAAEDPRSGLRGSVAMIPIAGLAPGRHELTVNRLRSQVASDDAPPPAPHRIVFWR